MKYKYFNVILILMVILNYMFKYFTINYLILCLFFILFLMFIFILYLANIYSKNFNWINILIIFKKLINLISLFILLFNSHCNWMVYVDYLIENGLETDVNINKAVSEIGLTADQKYYIKMGCIIIAIIATIIIGKYVCENYEIFKPVENNVNDVAPSLANPVNAATINVTENVVTENVENVNVADLTINQDIDYSLDPSKEYIISVELHYLWESLTNFNNEHVEIAKKPLIEEITPENIQFYKDFKYHYDAYCDYKNKGGDANTSIYIILLDNLMEAYLKIPEVQKLFKKDLDKYINDE